MSARNEPLPLWARPRSTASLLILALFSPHRALSDAGPPYLTNDPGTPGGGNWEINIGCVPELARGLKSYELPQLDINFGVGDRVQLTYEVPYVLQSADGERYQSGWSNALVGIKWRFFDQGEGGWQLSTFPQLEPAASVTAQRKGIAIDGPRLIVPVEAARTIGPLSLDFEAGYWLARHGPEETILGLVLGRDMNERLQLDVELYDDHVLGTPAVPTLDVGGRFRLHRGFILLFMAGRSLRTNSSGQAELMGYLGVQVLLSDYGLKPGSGR